MPTAKELRAQAKARKIKKYYKLNKPQLLSALGMSAELKSHKLSKGKGDAIAAQSRKLAKGDGTAKATIKGRLTRAVARELRQSGENLTQEQKREIALKTIKREAAQIKNGVKERRGGAVRKGGQLSESERTVAKRLSEKERKLRGLSERKRSRIPVEAGETMSVRDRREKMRRQFDPNSSGSRAGRLAAKEERRAIVGLGGEKKAREEVMEQPKLKAIEGGAATGKKIKAKRQDMSLEDLGGTGERRYPKRVRTDRGAAGRAGDRMRQARKQKAAQQSETRKMKPGLGDRIRAQVAKIREEDETQKRAISRILGASAQIAQNQDRLINDVARAVENSIDAEAAARRKKAKTQTPDLFKRLPGKRRRSID
jgi:hypothetical protein